MKQSFGGVLKLAVGIALAAVILYFAFRKIDWQDFLQKLEEVNYAWIVASMIIALAGYILRAYRWGLQLEPLGYRVSIYRMFLAVMSGYLANMLVPRLGEVTRCGALLKSDKIPISSSFGTVITERVVDLLALGLILLITLALQYTQLIAFMEQTVDTNVNWWLVGGILATIALAGGFVFFRYIYPSNTRIGQFSRGLVAGLTSLKDVRLQPFLLSTLAIWVIYFLMSYIVVFALPETSHLSWMAGFSILSAGVVAFVLPVQSGFGTFHVLVATMLVIYGINQTTGLFFASLLHTSQLFAVLLYGLVAVILSIFVKRHGHKTENTNT